MAMRGLFHAALKNEEFESLVWKYAPDYRAFFQIHAPVDRVQVTFDDDLVLAVSLADHIESMIFFHDMQAGDRGLIRFLKRLLKPGLVFVDIGANVGFYTLIAAKRVGYAGAVHAFEPVGTIYRLLEQNVDFNKFNSISLYRLALSDVCGEASIHIPMHANKGMSTLHPDPGCASEKEQVRTETLDRVMQGCGAEHVDIVKIDVEGHESSVIAGAVDTLRRFRPIVVCELSREHLERAGSSPEGMVAQMGGLGYRRYGLDEYGRPLAYARIADHENAVFVTPERTALLQSLGVA